MSTSMRYEDLRDEWIGDLLRRLTPEQQKLVLEALGQVKQGESLPLKLVNGTVSKPEKSAPQRSAK